MNLSVFKIRIGNYAREEYNEYYCKNELSFTKH